MKKLAGMLVGLGLVLGSTAAFAQEPPPKAEKSKKKTEKTKKKSNKSKAEQPKAQ